MEARFLNLKNKVCQSRHVKAGIGFAKRRLPKWLWVLIRLTFLVGLSFVVLYPVLISLSVAFRSPEDITDPAVLWIPKNFTLLNITETLKFMNYWKSLGNSFKIGIISSLLQVVSCALVGYGFARFRFKFKGLFFSMVIFTIIVPPQVVFVPTYLMYRDFHMLDTPAVMWLPALLGVGIRSGLFIYIFRQFYRNLPKELEDAALVDGCGAYKTYFKIIIPCAKPAFLTVFLFSVVWYWNDYYNTVMYFTNTQTVTTALARLSAAMLSADPNGVIKDVYLMSARNQAACLLTLLPMLLIYIVFHRFFTEGVERTGIVG